MSSKDNRTPGNSSRERCDISDEELRRNFLSLSSGNSVLDKEFLGPLLRICGFHPRLKQISIYEEMIDGRTFNFEKFKVIKNSQLQKHQRKKAIIASCNRLFTKLDREKTGFVRVSKIKDILMENISIIPYEEITIKDSKEPLFEEEYDIPLREYFGVEKSLISRTEFQNFMTHQIDY